MQLGEESIFYKEKLISGNIKEYFHAVDRSCYEGFITYRDAVVKIILVTKKEQNCLIETHCCRQ